MKNSIKVLTFLSLIFIAMQTEAINVVFQVDMSRELAVTSVSLAGDF